MRKLVLFLALFASIALAGEARALEAGDVAPDITFGQTWNGEQKKLSDFRGEFVLLNFWATW
ncbi:MAG: redoxin domain-containing protein [Planctomycetes bacterium]|nr:redoxin domain-containing protein [Planctomycetota bacterium]